MGHGLDTKLGAGFGASLRARLGTGADGSGLPGRTEAPWAA